MQEQEEELACANCGIELIVVDEPTVCQECGAPLCSICYDAFPYCGECETQRR
jgi:hypothetical protein